MENFEKVVADVDQATEHIKLFAPVLWGYLQSLEDAGFTRAEAFILVQSLQDKLFPNIGAK